MNRLKTLGCADIRVCGPDALMPDDATLDGCRRVARFDEAVAVMDEVGRGLPPELRETALGGIAKAPSACAFCAGFFFAPAHS